MTSKNKAVFFCSFTLKKGASAPEFLTAAKKLNDEYISKQQGHISWQQLNSGDTWTDLLTFETMEDVKSFEDNSAKNPCCLAKNFYSYINLMSCKVRYNSIMAEHGKGEEVK